MSVRHSSRANPGRIPNADRQARKEKNPLRSRYFLETNTGKMWEEGIGETQYKWGVWSLCIASVREGTAPSGWRLDLFLGRQNHSWGWKNQPMGEWKAQSLKPTMLGSETQHRNERGRGAALIGCQQTEEMILQGATVSHTLNQSQSSVLWRTCQNSLGLANTVSFPFRCLDSRLRDAQRNALVVL